MFLRGILISDLSPEKGTHVPDKNENGRVHDLQRIKYFKNHLFLF